MSEAIVGTWRFVKYADGRDSQLPGSYTFNADGSGSFNLPNGYSLAMKWKLADGRLSFGGVSGEGQTTVEFECPDADTLIFVDSNRLTVIYQKVR